MENKRKNIYVVLFVITTIIAGCLAAYFGIMRAKETEELNNQIASLKEKISDTETINNTNLSQDNIDENKNDNNIIDYNINIENCLNKEESAINYDLNINDSYFGVNAILNEDKKSVLVSIDFEELNSHFTTSVNIPNSGTQNGRNKNFTISNFEKEIIDLKCTSFGHTLDAITILFLMSDGTVEYIPLKNAINNDNFKSYGNLGEIKDIVSIKDCYFEINGGVKIPTIISLKSNNTFYDLYNILMDTGNYN